MKQKFAFCNDSGESISETFFDNIDELEILSRFFDNINIKYRFFDNCLEKKITFQELRTRCENYSCIVFDLNQFINEAEECIFAIYAKGNNKTERLSKYYYHYENTCYRNATMNANILFKEHEKMWKTTVLKVLK